MKPGRQYKTISGRTVTIVDMDMSLESTPKACVKGDDGMWRYIDNPPGRVTGSSFDMSHEGNIIPVAIKQKFNCNATVIDVLTNERIFIEREYTAIDIESARDGFVQYLRDNKTVMLPQNFKFSCEPFH